MDYVKDGTLTIQARTIKEVNSIDRVVVYADGCQREYLMPLPTVEERKEGYWIRDGHHIRCSECSEYICDKDREGDTIPQNYCPNCGARIKGE